MTLTMNELLEKYSDCDMFSLTGGVYNCNITEKEFLNALNKMKEKEKQQLKDFYNKNLEDFADYPSFDELYSNIEKECYEYNREENRKKYLEEKFDTKVYHEYKKMFMSDEKIEKIRNRFFHCSFIADEIGKTTKYGSKRLFYNFYAGIGMLIDRENSIKDYCFDNGKEPIKQVPKELRDCCLYYEVSFFNSVTESGGLMINYYFPLNDYTKKYLLKFKTDFDLSDLQDLTIYKNKEVKFYSCTHERFNSLEIN